MRTLDNFNRVINDLVVSLNTDVAPIINPSKPEGGYFGIPRSVFCYINFLGLLFGGWNGNKDKRSGEKMNFGSSSQAKRYIKEVLGKIDKNYVINGDLLYDVYRHGTVHIYSPKKMIANNDNDKTIEWLIYKGGRESWQYYENKAIKLTHLKTIKWSGDRFVMPLSINVLYDDLCESIDLYRRMVYEDKELLEKFSSVADALDNDHDVTKHDFWSQAIELNNITP